MKFSLLLMLLFLFSTNCGRLIQKNSAFKPVCGNAIGNYASCDGGNPTCGTAPGSGNLEAYCIDGDDTILKEAYCLKKRENDILQSPRCVPI